MAQRKRKTAANLKSTKKDVPLYKVVDPKGGFVYPGKGLPEKDAQKLSDALLMQTSIIKVYDPGDANAS